MQKPKAPAGTNCPLYRKDVSKVCHACEWYIHIRGKNPQSEQEIDHWGCAMAWGPILMIDNTQQQRGTGAAVESLRNLIARGMHREEAQERAQLALQAVREALVPPDPKLLNGN